MLVDMLPFASISETMLPIAPVRFENLMSFRHSADADRTPDVSVLHALTPRVHHRACGTNSGTKHHDAETSGRTSRNRNCHLARPLELDKV